MSGSSNELHLLFFKNNLKFDHHFLRKVFGEKKH